MVSPVDVFEVSFASFLVWNEFNYCLSKLAVRLGLTLTELQVLWTVVRFGETTMIEIARLVARPKHEFAPILDSLEADGLVTKSYQDESSKCVISATAAGQALIDQVSASCRGSCGFKKLDPEKSRAYVERAHELLSAFRGAEFVEKLKP